MTIDHSPNPESRDVRGSRTGHETAWTLLPWLAMNRLDGEELEGVLEHLKTCAECRDELRFLPEISGLADEDPDSTSDHGLERNLRRLHHRIEDREGRTGSGARWQSSRLVLAAAALLVASLSLILLRTEPEPVAGAAGPAIFRTLSDPPSAGPALRGERIRVVFSPDATISSIETLLGERDLEVVEGPGSRGIWTLRPSSGSDASRTVEKLRQRSEVRLAEVVGRPERTARPGDPS